MPIVVLILGKTTIVESTLMTPSSSLYANHPEGVLSLRVVKKKLKAKSKCGLYVSSA